MNTVVMNRPTQFLSKTETEKPSKITRNSRSVLTDASNRRQTRSLAAKARTAPTKTHADSSNTDADASLRRRSPRLSKKRGSDSSSGEHVDGKVEQVAAETRGRKPTMKKVSTKTATAKPTSRVSRSRSKPKSQEPVNQSGPEQAAVVKKTRGRSKTSRKVSDSDSSAVESKQTRPAAKRSRIQEDALAEQPARKVARATRSRSRPTEASVKATPKLLVDEFMEETNYTLVSLPFNPCKYTEGLSVYDTPSRGNVLEAPEYVTDIFQRLFDSEDHTRPHPYMHKQTTLTVTMRAILVDWLVEVHMKFRLVPETLYLCINILDRYLSIVDVERSKLQLVGVTALFIACKYEEIYPPEVRDCVYITDRGFTRQEVLNMENEILTKLCFKISVSTGHPFLQRFLFITNATTTMKFAANYYMERVLQEHEFLAFRPSIIAAAAVCLALNHPGIRENDSLTVENPGVPSTLLEYTGYSTGRILAVARMMASKIREEVVTVSRRELMAVKRKYDEEKYDYISVDFDAPDVNDISSD